MSVQERRERTTRPKENDMEAKHTPGPWKFGETPSLDGQGIAFEVDTDDFTIAHVYPTFDSGNAALIAAAPYLLSVLDTVAVALEDYYAGMSEWDDGLLATVRAALAKAEGR